MTPTNTALVVRERSIPDWLKSGFLVLFVFAACWGGAIAYWRTTGGNPTTGELASYLLGLPATLLLTFFMGRKLLARSTASTPSPAVSPTPAASALTSTPTSGLAILAASLRLPHGASPEELASAIADNKARADLDKELVDAEGFPVMAVRRRDALDADLQEEITAWLALNGMAELHFSDEQWRALTLASAVVEELAAQAASALDVATKLQLIPILPTEWGAGHRRATGMWFKHEMTRHGWSADRVVLTADETSSADDVTPSAVFKRLAHDAGTADLPLVALVVACASHIGDETVTRWAANGALFTSSRPQMQMPGEGAAGFLIANQAGLPGGEPIALLDGIEEARRNLSADESKRSDSSLLGELSERVLERGAMKASDVTMLVADTGHRSSRAFELMAHVSAQFPQLEETGDVIRAGVASGSCGDVSFMTALALGIHYARERRAPVLCISNEDPYRRAVALIRPSNLASSDV